MIRYSGLLLGLVMGLVPMARTAAAPADAPALTSTAARPVEDESTIVPIPEASPRAMEYYHSGNWLWVVGELWDLTVPLVLLVSGVSARMRNAARRIGRFWFFTVGLYLTFYLVLSYILDWPLSYYAGFVRPHSYDLSNQTFGRWFGNSLKAVGVVVVAGFLFVWVPYLLLARSPRRWWLYTALLSVPFLFGVMLVEPIWVDPLFNKFGPMKDKAARTEDPRSGPAARGSRAGRVYEVDKSARYQDGQRLRHGVFLQTKRIVLWDTLLAKHDEKGVLFVMGHEMGHYVLGHVVRSILLSSIVTLAGLFWVDRAGRWLIARYGDRWGFHELSDIASLPLLLALLQVSTLVLVPLVFAYSRAQEHEADRFALEITRTNHSGAVAFLQAPGGEPEQPSPGLALQALAARRIPAWAIGSPSATIITPGARANRSATRGSFSGSVSIPSAVSLARPPV